MLVLLPLALIAVFTGAYGVGSSYLSAALALGVCNWVGTSPTDTTLITVGCYLTNLLAGAAHEFGGTSSDAALALGAFTPGVVPVKTLQYSNWKAAALGISACLPIGNPPHIMGVGGLVLAGILLLLVRKLSARVLVVIIVSGVLYTIAWHLVAPTSTLAKLGLIAGLFVPSLVWPDCDTPQDPAAFPNPLGVVAAGFYSWITPGFTTGLATTTLLNPTIYRPAVTAVIGGAIEGWNLQLIERGGESSKTPLGSLLGTQLEPCEGMILLAVIIALGAFFRPIGNPTLPHARWISVGSLITQSVLTTGVVGTLTFLVTGVLAHGIQLVLAPGSGETRSLAFLIPIATS
jgi:hypothetical protein